MNKTFLFSLVLIVGLFSAFSFASLGSHDSSAAKEDVKIVHKASWENI
jgi:hypothetical protein